jgi:hypothetical protein
MPNTIPAKYQDCDFAGWATRNDLRCSDGRTIRRDAFAHQDGAKVPLVWGHNHDSPNAVLGHGFLENRPEGVFFYGYFNDSEDAKRAKQDVMHRDVTSLSIWANQLKQSGGDVLHGSIKEVSLVLAGANMGAQITYPIIMHGDDPETLMDEAYIYIGEDYGLELGHADEDKDGGKEVEKEKTIQDIIDTMDEDQLKVLAYLVGQAASGADENEDEAEPDADTDKDEVKHSDLGKDATVQDVIDTMNDDQLKVMKYLIAKAAEDAAKDAADNIKHSDNGGEAMNFNAFDAGAAQTGAYLSHEDEMNIISVAKKYGKLSDALAAYAEENELSHDDLAPVSGATSYPDGQTPAGVDGFLPEYHDVYPGAPQVVTNDQAWVKAVLNKVHKSPFSRIRTSYVDIRGIEALRARGYLKGKEKTLAGNYTVAKRVTDPQTVYVKSALNHDDVVDITDFDYIDYQYKIDRAQLELELAQAMLIGDGRDDADADKINPDHIRPIWTDNDIYTIHKALDLSGVNGDFSGNFGDSYKYAQATEEAILDAKIDFKGTGTPDMFCTQAFFNKMMLAKDLNGRRLYANKGELTSALDVGNVYSVPEFVNKTRTANNKTYRLLAIIGNLADYALGQTKGGEIIHRTQFDIDFNQEKSLLETRVSGATTRLYSFIVIEEEVTGNGNGNENP